MTTKFDAVRLSISNNYDFEMFKAMFNVLLNDYMSHLNAERTKKILEMDTLYRVAIEHNREFDFIKLLIENGARVNDPIPFNHMKNFDQLKYLFENGLHVQIYYFVDGHNLLTYYCKENNFEAIKYLVNKYKKEGLSLEQPYKQNGSSPLMFAAQENNFEIFEFLLQNGANPRAINNDGLDVKYWVNFKLGKEKLLNLLNKYLDNNIIDLLDENQKLKQELEQLKEKTLKEKEIDEDTIVSTYLVKNKNDFDKNTLGIINKKLLELYEYKKLGTIQQIENYKKVFDKVQKGELPI